MPFLYAAWHDFVTDAIVILRHYENIYHIENKKLVNPTGIKVLVTKSGSITKEMFPAFCRHFVNHLPRGQGKDGEPVTGAGGLLLDS